MSKENEDLQFTPQVAVSSNLFLPISLGVAGILLGLIALFTAFSVSGHLNSGDENFSNREGEMKKLSAEIRSLKKQMTHLEMEGKQQIKQIESIIGQTQTAFSQVGREIGSTRSKITENAEKIREIIENLNLPFASATSKKYMPSRAALKTSTQERKHVISGGDTFAKLAAKYKVSVDAILAANTDVDPRLLQIGQKIIIPANQ